MNSKDYLLHSYSFDKTSRALATKFSVEAEKEHQFYVQVLEW